MNNHRVTHTAEYDIPGGTLAIRIAEPYMSKDGYYFGKTTTISLSGRFPTGERISFSSRDDARSFLSAALDKLAEVEL